MNAIFLVSAFLMLLLAMSFATAPLLQNARMSSRGFATIPLLAVLAVFFLAIGLYATIGRPDFATGSNTQDSSRTAAPSPPATEKSKAASVNELLAGLEQRLQDNPDDAKGWLLLAKSYDHLGRTGDAAAAYEKASALGLSDSVLEARLQ